MERGYNANVLTLRDNAKIISVPMIEIENTQIYAVYRNLIVSMRKDIHPKIL